MRKRVLAFTLSIAMVLGLAWQPAYAADSGTSGSTTADHWFYNQLSGGAKAIYNALENAYKSGELKTGTKSVSLDSVIGSTAATDYLKGNRSLFNDFSAAKDAFDLEHPEAWYFDSAQLSLTVEGNTSSATASMGTGKSDSYFVMGANDGDGGLTARDKALEDEVAAIAATARTKSSTYEQIKYVHDAVVNSISYRYEFECSDGNEGFVRTAYALITHEGVCEGYVRSFQMILNELGIPCVPIHGMQTSGTPEAHMWCAVYISDEKSTGWYVVDPTWDDPVVLSGARAAPGLDGGERYDYFMVGNDVIGSQWIPSGHVSTGAMEFAYPSIAPRSYGAGQIEVNGLVVTYDDGLMEDTASTVYQISYNGMGLYEASKKGFYFLVKMYDLNADGSQDKFEDWYYAVHGLLALGDSPDNFNPDGPLGNNGNKYYHDTEKYLVQAVSNCEYVEFAVTSVKPAWANTGELITKGGYLKDHGGTEADIVAQTGLIYNPNGNYEQPPYVKNMQPAQNVSSYVGATHTIHMEFTDPLFHPDAASIAKSAALGKVNEAESAMAEHVGLDYSGTNYSWGVNGGLPHQFADKPAPKNVRWYCTTHGIHTSMSEIEFYGSACRLTTLEFEFTPSVMWADDSVSYEFYVTGLVGTKSNKRPGQTGMALVFENESAFCAYRCVKKGGIDWNLWGQPQLLDDPNSLDFSKLVVEGIDGARENIEQLYGSMNLDQYDMNGRLLLVVEDAGADKAKADTMSDLLESKMDVDLQNAIASALYEIDFARVCSKTVVETGQSLRMQVGFPAGFDASKLNQTVFKVYHFIKDKETGKITGVEEIPVTVTPYGLVFQVSSFSPFAIVAENGTPDTSRSAVLAVEGPGKIEIVGYEAGKMEVNGTVALTPGQSYTVKVIPDQGYVVDGITATGLMANHSIVYDTRSNTFTLHYNDIGSTNAIIGISLVAGSSDAVEDVSVLPLCGHESKTLNTDGIAATCTKDGKTPTVICNTCGQIISGGEVIKATGHDYGDLSNYKAPTCTEDGTRLTCKNCGMESQAFALGHDYRGGVCTRENCNNRTEQCTVTFNPNGGQIVSGSAAVKVSAGSMLKTDMWPMAARAGHKFAGWRTSTDPEDLEGADIDSDLKITRSIVLYAMWDEADTSGLEGYEIILNANGGILAGDSSVRTDKNGKLTEMPGDPAREGYTFDGWFSSSENGIRITLDTVFTGSATIYAHWLVRGSGSSGTTTETETSGDGTVTTTETDSTTGASTETVTRPDGSVSVTKTDAAGNISRTESFANGVEVSTNIPVNGSVSASISIPAGMTSACVTIRAAVTAGTVAVYKDTGKVVMLSVPVDGGLKVVLNSSADIILVDLSKDFDDMPDDHWAADSVDFVTSHGLFYGTGTDTFSPSSNMTRAMLMTVLARFNGVDTNSGSTWYGPGMEWAMANGISDGTYPDSYVKREQLAAMLYRYAGSPELSGAGDQLSGYPDISEISDWAYQAMCWAVQNGIIQGSGGYLKPGGYALRSEVAAMIERFCRNVAMVN